MANLIAWATGEAESRLTPLGRRLVHVRAVAARAREIGPAVVGENTELLVTAALLHDIGYASELAVTGFHPLDGARFCREVGRPQIAALVAHHTGARNEAHLRGLPALLQEFPFRDSLEQRALTYCDLTTGPNGDRTGAAARVAEILERYGSGHVVSRAAEIGLPEFLAIEAEIEGILTLSGSPASSG